MCILLADIGGIVAGVIVGILFLLGIALVIALVLFFVWRRRSSKGKDVSVHYKNVPLKKSVPPNHSASPKKLAPPVTASPKKSASSEDLLNTKKHDLNDSYNSDDSFEDVAPAAYDNVSYDPVTDKHVPLKGMAPPPGNKKLPPSRKPPQMQEPFKKPAVPAVQVRPTQAKPLAPNGKTFAPAAIQPTAVPFKSSLNNAPNPNKPNPHPGKPTPPSTTPPTSSKSVPVVKSKPVPEPPAKSSEETNNSKPLPLPKNAKPSKEKALPVAPTPASKPVSKPTAPKPSPRIPKPLQSQENVDAGAKKVSMAPPRFK